jgi:hypothetical protein
VSYFLRNSKAYDTLLQMSRWFGYRDDYHEFCRVWLSPEAEGWYRHIADASNELKRDFARMRRQRATPAEFGLRVRTHPDTLLITARNKMATGINLVGEVRDISLAGRGIETARLYADQKRNEENFRIVDRFLSDLVDRYGAAGGSPNGNAVLWRGVSAGMIRQLLVEFLVHPLNHDFQGDAIAEFLADAVERADPQLSTWTVAVPIKGEKGPVTPDCAQALRSMRRSVWSCCGRHPPIASCLGQESKSRKPRRRSTRVVDAAGAGRNRSRAGIQTGSYGRSRRCVPRCDAKSVACYLSASWSRARTQGYV